MTPRLEQLAAGSLLASFSGEAPPPWLVHRVGDGLGGVCLFGSTATEDVAPAVAAVLHDAGSAIVAIDEEGGDVTRLHARTGSPVPGPAALGAVDDPALTEALHRALGAELAAAGIDLDLAPVADINTDPTNPVIGVRSFGDDPARVARHVVAAVTGLQAAGVAACAKHFPGHGDTTTDSHLAVPVLDVSAEVLHRRELTPFRAAVAAGVSAVMTGHLVVPAVDSAPATFSPVLVGGWLRREVGFDGVVVTDALDMAGAAGPGGLAGAVVRALAAGADLCCLGSGATEDLVQACIGRIVDAVRAGRLVEEALTESAGRIRRLRGHPGVGVGDPELDLDVLGAEAAARALRVDGPRRPVLRSAHVVELDAAAGIAAGEVPWGVGVYLADLDPTTTVERVPIGAGPSAPVDGERPLVVVTRDAHRHADQRNAVAALLAARPDAVLVELGWPDPDPPAAAARVVTYGASAASGRAAARLLAGLEPGSETR